MNLIQKGKTLWGPHCNHGGPSGEHCPIHSEHMHGGRSDHPKQRMCNSNAGAVPSRKAEDRLHKECPKPYLTRTNFRVCMYPWLCDTPPSTVIL